MPRYTFIVDVCQDTLPDVLGATVKILVGWERVVVGYASVESLHTSIVKP